VISSDIIINIPFFSLSAFHFNTLQSSVTFAAQLFALFKKLVHTAFIILFLQMASFAQRGFPSSDGGGFNPQRLGGSGLSGLSSLGSGGGGQDSLRRRDKFEDSITVYFKYLDSTSYGKLDSSIKDFRLRFPVPATNIFLGNVGNASRSLLFSPKLIAGWDAGFHSFDIYRWKKETTRFIHTTRPYSEINYQLGARSEQIIELLHTQNIKANWNFSFNYRMINSPGFFKNQKTNHNNYIVTSWYQSLNKRYNNYFMLVSNKLQAAENGGIKNDQNYLDNIVYKDRFNIPTNIGGDPQFGRDFFSTKIETGNKYTETVYVMRQQYDFGKKDSLISDSTIYYLYYPRLRFEHTLNIEKNKYLFQDFVGDSAYYKDVYDTTLAIPTDTFELRENWTVINNDFSVYQFPDIKNQQQFIKLGLLVQNIKGRLSKSTQNYYNLVAHAEYRNKTRNQKWEMFLEGKLYLTGNNFSDYEATAALRRFVSNKIGYLQLGFQNVNRTPSFIYNSRSSFYLLKNEKDFKKENTTHFFASLTQPRSRMNVSGHYYLLTNYTYIQNYYELSQETSLFNVLQISAERSFKLGKKFAWHSEIYFQQVIGNAPVNLPLIFTRNRFAYEGPTGFKNLNISTGIEFRFHTPYKADGYSPALGQFYYQDSVTIENQVPEISAYLHFRIRPMKFFIRAENLNTVRKLGNINFTNNIIETPDYPMPGLQLRLGLYWSFVN
jgi:hypothetical protein